ncbi:MAG TPA: CPBP family intramembrane glutamic endopeptidase [Rhizomicrobium sp.]|nr:CPBP family intramembrane glutamic endopeptidase [Rhizomicrobium sp.]
MLDRRATRIVWAFLIGVIAIEGWLIYASFKGHGDLVQAVAHYAFTPPANALAWICAAALAILYIAYAAANSATIREHLLRPSRWKPFIALCIVAVPMALISGYFEEAFFRKFLMDVALRHGQSAAMQVVLSAVAFGFVHAIWGIASGNFRGAVGSMIATGVLGAGLAVIYLVGGRSVAPCMAAHIVINLVLEPWLIITAATNGWGRSPKVQAAP